MLYLGKIYQMENVTQEQIQAVEKIHNYTQQVDKITSREELVSIITDVESICRSITFSPSSLPIQNKLIDLLSKEIESIVNLSIQEQKEFVRISLINLYLPITGVTDREMAEYLEKL